MGKMGARPEKERRAMGCLPPADLGSLDDEGREGKWAQAAGTEGRAERREPMFHADREAIAIERRGG